MSKNVKKCQKMSKKPKKRSKKWFFRGFGVKKSHMEPRFFLTFFRKPLKTPVFGLFLTIFDPFFDHFWPFFPYFPEVPAKNSQKPEKMVKKSIFWRFLTFFWLFLTFFDIFLINLSKIYEFFVRSFVSWVEEF